MLGVLISDVLKIFSPSLSNVSAFACDFFHALNFFIESNLSSFTFLIASDWTTAGQLVSNLLSGRKATALTA